MDNNNFQLNSETNGSNTNQVNHSSPQDANYTNPVNLSKQNSGLDQQTFGTTAAGNASGTYGSVNTGNASGTYNAVDSGNYNGTYNAADSNATYVSQGGGSPFEQEAGKKAKSSLIIGIIAMVLNLIFCAIPFVTDWVFSPGWIFIFLEIVGIQNAVQGKKSVSKKGMAITGLVLNIISLVWSILLVILVLVLKFLSI